MAEPSSESYKFLQAIEPSTEDKIWTSVGACMFAISTLANAGLAMVLLVNLRPGASNHITDYAGCSDGQVTTVNRRNGHTGFTPFLLITLSNLATNILDSLLLLLAAGLRPDTTQGRRIDTSSLLDKPECHSLQRWMVAVDLSLPMKICCQVMTNLLAIGAFLYTSEHEDIHIEKPQRKGGSTDPILELSQMSRTRVITLIAICWLLPIVLMWHPMLINCLEDHVALQLVLYGWMAYMLWVLVTIAVVTVDRGIQNGLTMKSYRRRNHADLVDTNSTEYRVSSMYTYMAHYKIRHESFAMLCLLVLGASTTLPWPLVELFHIFRHVRGTKPATASLVSLRLVLQVLPYIYYMAQPVALILGFHRIRKRLKFNRQPSTEPPIQLVPSNSADPTTRLVSSNTSASIQYNSTDPSTRLVSSSTRNSMQLINSTCVVEHD